jgi:two-component system, OmpR family, sensor histidine kinase SenX3
MAAESHYPWPWMNGARLAGEQLATGSLTSTPSAPYAPSARGRRPYHPRVDATSAALLGGALGLVVGAGAVAALRVTRAEAGSEPAQAEPLLPDGATAVLSALRSGSVVVDSAESVVWASSTAYSWGLVRDDRLTDDEIVRAVRRVRAEADVESMDLEPRRRRRGGPRLLLSVRVAPLTPDLVVVLADDRSELARVDDVRRDFVANVSHELKTPVGALSLLAEAVEGASDDPEAVLRFAGRMQHEAARLSSMVNELIELSRLQNDDVRTHSTLVPIDDVIADGCDFVRTAVAAKQIDLRATGEHGLVVFGVREQLVTALRNLLDNAVNYSPERTRVVVAAHAVDDRVEISVADQGIGISDADQARVFERFYRVDPARSRATGGTGLGLSIVKHVCVNHGGDVVVWSAEGSGSTFTLRLPDAAVGAPNEIDDPADLIDGAGASALLADSAADSPNATVYPLRKVVP